MTEWRLAQRRVAAPVGGRVADVLAEPGETMMAGAPVVSLLPAENILVRFFVPEPSLAPLHRGDEVSFAFEACPPGLAGTVSFISPQAEYTPPLIYSESRKAKLVYRLEARPRPDQASLLTPGQPIVERPKGPGPGQMTAHVIDVHDLTKSFGRHTVVRGLDLRVDAGEICGFLVERILPSGFIH